jgi:hypothetical protein
LTAFVGTTAKQGQASRGKVRGERLQQQVILLNAKVDPETTGAARRRAAVEGCPGGLCVDNQTTVSDRASEADESNHRGRKHAGDRKPGG